MKFSGRKANNTEPGHDQDNGKANEMALFVNNQITTKLSYWDKDLICLYANDSYLEWFGKTREEMIGKTIQQLMGPDIKSLDFMKMAVQGQKMVFERNISPRGTITRHTMVTYYPDFGDNGSVKGFISQIDDITELKEKELALTASELKFRSILESAPDAIVIADSDGIIRLVNSQSEEMFQYNKEELIGKPVEILMPERFRKTHPQKRNSFATNPHSRPMGNLILFGRRKNGEEFPTDVSLSPMKTEEGILISAAFRDISWKVEKENELLKSHNEIRDKAQQIENILENITDSFAIIDKEWIIRYWNRSAEIVTSKLRAEVLGENLWDLFIVSKNTVIYNNFKKAMVSQVPVHFEHYSKRMYKWFDVSVYPSAEGVTTYFKDITVRRNHETELMRVKNNLSAMINASKDMLWSIDANYKLVSANQAFSDFVKDTNGNEIQEGDNVLIGLDKGKVNQEWKQQYDRSLAGESFIVDSMAFAGRQIRFDPIYDSSQQIIGVACHSLDTAERNQLEKEKIETAQRFTAIVQNGSDLIFILNENTMPTYVSPSVYSHLGYTPEFLYGKSAAEFIHPKDFAKLILMAESFAGQQVMEIPPIRIRHSNGSWRWIESTIDNLFDHPAVQGLVLTAKDITERKKRETERDLMFKELTRSNNDLKQFSFITSHNLRAPLSNITGLLAVLDLDVMDAGNKEILGMVEKAAGQLKETIDDITEIVVIKNTIDTPMSSIDVAKMFNRVNKNFLNTENDIAARILLDFAVSEIRFNKTYLESIFINLISNAIKYRQAGVTLKIEVSTHLNEEGKTVLVFRDNGIGIDLKRHKDRLFGMYQRFHSTIEGQGLGLFIVKSQIEALGGRIDAESELDKGTKFIITFP